MTAGRIASRAAPTWNCRGLMSSASCRGALAARGRTSHGRGYEFAAAQPDFRRKAEPKAAESWWICDPAEFPARAIQAAKRMNAVTSHYETRVAV